MIPANTSGGALACTAPNSSDWSSMFIAGAMIDSDCAIISGGMLATIASSRVRRSSAETCCDSITITSNSSNSWCCR